MFIEFGGVKFWARGYRAQPGDTCVFGLRPGAWDAFMSTAGMVTEQVARPGSDGEYALPGYLGGKIRGFSALALASSQGELDHMRDVVTALAGGYRSLVVDNGRRQRRAVGQVFGTVDFKPRRDRFQGMLVADIDMSIRTPEPFWLGDVTSYAANLGTAVTITHRGNAVSWPRFEIAGPVNAGWWLRIGEKRLDVPSPVEAGETVVVERGTVVSSTRGPLTGLSGVVPSIPPAWTGSVHCGGVGSGSVTVRVTDTWLTA